MLDKNKIYSKTTLYAIGKTKEARFVLNDYKGAIKLTVFEREINKDSKKRDKYKLGANLFIRREALYALINEMKELPKKDVNHIFTITLYSPVWTDDKPTGDIKESGTVSLLRKQINEDIINYLVISDNKVGSKYIFKLLPTPYYTFSINGKIVNDTVASEIFTRAYARTLESIMDLVPEAYTEEANITEINNNTKPLTTEVKKEEPKQEEKAPDIDDLLNDII